MTTNVEPASQSTNLTLPASTVQNNAGDVLSVLGELVWPGVGGK